MGVTSLCPVSFVLFWMSVARARVEPPANVTLHCQSMNNVLKWDYSQITPGLRFRVDIRAYYGTNADGFQNVTWVEPPAHEADLSFLSDPLEAYLLTVTAVVGDKESDPSPSDNGITFSYDKGAGVDHKCFVDLSSVTLTAQPHDSILLRFPHPWLILHERVPRQNKTRMKKSHDVDPSDEPPDFEYRVTFINQTQDHHSHSHSDLCAEAVCEKTLPVDPQQEEHCLTISGDMTISEGMGSMLVKGGQVYCAPSFKIPPAHDHTYTYVSIGLGLLVAAVVLVMSMIYCKKTKSSSETPGFLIFRSPPSSTLVVETNPAVAVAVTVEEEEEEEAGSPDPLLTPDVLDSTDFFPPATDSSDYASRTRLGLPSEDEGVPDDFEEGRPGEDASAYMHGGSLDEDEVPSCYERRVVPVQLEPGDVAEGYRG